MTLKRKYGIFTVLGLVGFVGIVVGVSWDVVISTLVGLILVLLSAQFWIDRILVRIDHFRWYNRGILSLLYLLYFFTITMTVVFSLILIIHIVEAFYAILV